MTIVNTEKPLWKRIPVYAWVLIGSFVALSLLILLPPSRESIDPADLPWSAQYDTQGKLQVIGMTIGQSTLNDVMKRYGKDVEIKMFSDMDESNKVIEAYFPVIYIGSIKAALNLRLDVPTAELDKAYEQGKSISASPTGGREVELYSDDLANYLDRPFTSLTLLPKKHLTERAIITRFGEPDKDEVQSDKLRHLFYYRLGLELIVDEEGPEALQYSNHFYSNAKLITK